MLNVFCSSLILTMAEALVCAQDLLQSTPLSRLIEKNLEDLEIVAKYNHGVTRY